MASRIAVVPLVLAVAAGCTFDTSVFKASGSGGASATVGTTSHAGSGVTSTSSPSATSDATATVTGTTDTTAATTSTTTNATTATSATSSATTATTAATTATSSATTATTAVSTVASTSSGGSVDLPFCLTGSSAVAVTDPFAPTAYNPTFWNATGNVAESGQMNGVILTEGTGLASLLLKQATHLSTDCAITVVLAGGNQGTNGRLRIGGSPMTETYRIRFENSVLDFGPVSNNGGTTSQPLTLPATLALVSHAGNLYAGYKAGTTWTLLAGTYPLPSGDNVGISEELGNFGDWSGWRDFNVHPVSLADLGL